MPSDESVKAAREWLEKTNYFDPTIWGESLAALLEKQEARIEAALGLYETAMEIPPLAEQMYKALKGEEE